MVWAGIYSRARNLHKAARIIEEKYGGVMPTTTEELMGLPESANLQLEQ